MSTGCMLVPHPQPCPQLCSMSLGSRHALPMNPEPGQREVHHDTSILAPTEPLPRAVLCTPSRPSGAILGRGKAESGPASLVM